MTAWRCLLGSSFVLAAACSAEKLPLGEGEIDGGTGGASGSGGTSGSSGSSGSSGANGSSGASGSSGRGGAGGSGQPAACQPTDPICYGNRPANSPGSECLANVDNTSASRVQFRQTWIRDIAPAGNTMDIISLILKQRTQLRLPECYSTGPGGYIQITSWDRSNPDPTQQTVTTGYASYSAARPESQPASDVVRDGLCFADWTYSYDGPPLPTQVDTTRWPEARPQPWNATPVVALRVAADFEAATGLAFPAPRVYIDEPAGYMHAFIPLLHVTLLDNGAQGIMMPVRAVETKWQFNDNSFNCVGRFRADALRLDTNCDTGSDRQNPQWGCADDRQCPPGPGFGDLTGPGAGPGYTRGYILIVDLERVWSRTLQSTLCVTYPGEQKSIADGWAKPDTAGGWGKNCRGSPKWNPSLPDDAGLPMGDWCSRTNSPATATCHDAYRIAAYSAAQAFKVREGTCPLVAP